MPAIATRTSNGVRLVIPPKKVLPRKKETIEVLLPQSGAERKKRLEKMLPEQQPTLLAAEAKKKADLEALGAELQDLTVQLINEGKLKPFNRKDIYGNL